MSAVAREIVTAEQRVEDWAMFHLSCAAKARGRMARHQRDTPSYAADSHLRHLALQEATKHVATLRAVGYPISRRGAAMKGGRVEFAMPRARVVLGEERAPVERRRPRVLGLHRARGLSSAASSPASTSSSTRRRSPNAAWRCPMAGASSPSTWARTARCPASTPHLLPPTRKGNGHEPRPIPAERMRGIGGSDAPAILGLSSPARRRSRCTSKSAASSRASPTTSGRAPAGCSSRWCARCTPRTPAAS
jgi:hypothetical protein